MPKKTRATQHSFHYFFAFSSGNAARFATQLPKPGCVAEFDIEWRQDPRARDRRELDRYLVIVIDELSALAGRKLNVTFMREPVGAA